MTTVNCCYNCANSFKVAYGTVLCCTEHKCQVEPCNYCEKWRCIGAIWQSEAWNRRAECTGQG